MTTQMTTGANAGAEVPAPGTGSAPGTPILRIRDLRITFDTPAGPLRAVDGIDLDLDPGSTIGIVGESGSGKSVLARAAMGLLPKSARYGPDSVIEFDGRRLYPDPPKNLPDLWGNEMALIFQDPMTSLTPVMTVGGQLTETLRRHLPLSRRKAREKAVDLLRRVGIPDPEARMRTYPHRMSGGMRQRVMIALSIACDPRLLFADEPTTALDVTVQRQILDLLADLQTRLGTAMVLVTHDLGVVAGRADRIAVMYAGRIVETAPTKELFRNLAHPYTAALLESIPRLDSPSGTRLKAIGGLPPRVVGEPSGCAFAPRCPRATDRCLSETPELVPVAPDASTAEAVPTRGDGVQGVAGRDAHLVACHHPLTGEER